MSRHKTWGSHKSSSPVRCASRHLSSMHVPCADAMCGCVVAPQPLDTLEVWATQAFAGVRPGQAQEEPLLSPQDPAPAQAMPTASATPPQQNQEQAPGLAVRRWGSVACAGCTSMYPLRMHFCSGLSTYPPAPTPRLLNMPGLHWDTWF